MKWLLGAAVLLLAAILALVFGVRQDQRRLTAEVTTLTQAVRELTQVIRETKLPPGPRLSP